MVLWVQKQYPNTYILIYGDHTPAIPRGEFHQASLKYNSTYFEYVPLFLITPDNAIKFENRYATTFLDVAPTILAASKGAYHLHTFGESLLDTMYSKSKIPFRGVSYTREFLYNLIATELRKNRE
jgi:phosphoglycerol transferase MdoB-like AlkP superfamily enzyme